MKKMSMTMQILLAMILGMIFGFVFQEKILFVGVFGTIFLRLIQMSVVLLIMGAVIEALGRINPLELGKIAWKVVFSFLISTVFAALVGLGLALLIRPGQNLNIPLEASNIELPASQTVQSMIVNFIPTNIISAMANANMIQVIVFAILFGLAIARVMLKKKKNTLLQSISDFNVVLLEMIQQIMKIAPIGIFALVAQTCGEQGVKIIFSLFLFLVCLALGTVFIMFVYILLTALYVQVNPFVLTQKLGRMSVMAFTTTSSAITLPIKMEDQENKLGVSKEISKLVGPLAMALNSNGLSMYLSIACITLCQYYNVQLGVAQIIQIIVLATLACLGTVVVPGGGLVALASVIPAIGLPAESFSLLGGIDWFSGMFRTVLNVDVDALIALVIAKSENEFDRNIFDGRDSLKKEM